jgi:hypothetical protein
MSNKLGIYFAFIVLYNLALSIPFTFGASSVDREVAIPPADENKPTSKHQLAKLINVKVIKILK